MFSIAAALFLRFPQFLAASENPLRYDFSMNPTPIIRVGMVGMGMIFEETYRPLFEAFIDQPLYHPIHGPIEVRLTAVASRTGQRANAYLHSAAPNAWSFQSFTGQSAVADLLDSGVDVVCVATPDDRHFEVAKLALGRGKHVLIEKPSVLSVMEWDILQDLAERNRVLAKVVYHKLADPDHKKLRTLVADGILQHVNSGYCSLLEPKSISTNQFAEWIQGRNPGSYVAVHYLKLIDFSFSRHWWLSRISATGQRGIVGAANGNTWDSVQLQVVYTHPDAREAAFDIHTSWVTPDNFPGYVEQEVQFRFDNAIWNAHQRKRGVEVTIEGKSPGEFKYTPNYHYNGTFLEPWGERSQRGYGIEVLHRFFTEVAFTEYAKAPAERSVRLAQMRSLTYNDLSADRNCVAIVQAMEAILRCHAQGRPGATVIVNGPLGGLVLYPPGDSPELLYSPAI